MRFRTIVCLYKVGGEYIGQIILMQMQCIISCVCVSCYCFVCFVESQKKALCFRFRINVVMACISRQFPGAMREAKPVQARLLVSEDRWMPPVLAARNIKFCIRRPNDETFPPLGYLTHGKSIITATRPLLDLYLCAHRLIQPAKKQWQQLPCCFLLCIARWECAPTGWAQRVQMTLPLQNS